jgi:hypothetical protein
MSAVALAGLAWTASIAEAVTITTCSDTGLTYSESCPADPSTGNRCIVPVGSLNGCCNKGTCNNNVCVTGADQDAPCLNDGNDCTDGVCHQNGSHQSVCSFTNSPNTKECNNDSNVCTIDKCDGSGTCASTGVTNTCAAEQANNEEPICSPFTCHPSTGCDNNDVPNSPVLACDDGKDCTTGDHCVDGVCGKGRAPGTVLSNGYPCRADDTNLSNGDQRTWCRAGVCNDTDEACDQVEALDDGDPCDPNPCTNSFCDGDGANGVCVIASCNTGQTHTCQPCFETFECLNHGVGQSANIENPCGCLSLFE